MKKLFLACLVFLTVPAYCATVKATGQVKCVIIAAEPTPEPNTVVYTEVGPTLQVVF